MDPIVWLLLDRFRPKLGRSVSAPRVAISGPLGGSGFTRVKTRAFNFFILINLNFIILIKLHLKQTDLDSKRERGEHLHPKPK